MGFDKIKKGSGIAHNAYAKIRKSGTIGFGQAAMSKYFEDAEGVEIFYDHDEERLGFKPVSEKTSDSYALNKRKGTGTLNCTSILRDLGLEDREEKLELHEDDEHDLVYVELSEIEDEDEDETVEVDDEAEN